MIRYLKDLYLRLFFNNSGLRIIKEFIGIDIIVAPILLLIEKEWCDVAIKHKHAEKGYILTYFCRKKC